MTVAEAVEWAQSGDHNAGERSIAAMHTLAAGVRVLQAQLDECRKHRAGLIRSVAGDAPNEN